MITKSQVYRMSTKKTKIKLDGRWNLEELSEATKGYTQLYGFAYSLLPDISERRQEEIDFIYGKFPWRGGYSTVNFFNQLFHKTPHNLHPEVVRIQYASPGFIELSELLIVSGSVAALVKAVSSIIQNAHKTYREIQKGCMEHKLAKINLRKEHLELTQRQLTFCETASDRLVKLFGLSKAQNKILDQKVQGNKIIKLKILLSVFRRVEPLAKKQSEGKLEFTGKESDGI